MIRYVDYKGEQLPICIDVDALEKLEGEGLKFDDSDLKTLKRLFWHSLVSGHFHDGKELKIKEENCGFYFGWCFPEFKDLMPDFMERLTRTKKPKAAGSKTAK